MPTKYATIFKINYDDEFKKFAAVGVSTSASASGSVDDVYHLECLEILSLENWNKCFRVNNARKIIDINYPYFGDICCDLQKSLKGTLNFTGDSFTNEPLIPGDLETYYFQYMAQQMFGSHVAFHAFQNLAKIKKKISFIPKQIIKVLQERKILKEFYKIIEFRDGNLDGNLDEKLENKLFKKGDVLEISIFFKKPNLDIHSPSGNMVQNFESIKNKYYIKDSLWKIYFILL